MALVLGRYGVSLRDARGQVGKVGGFYTFNDDTGAHRGGAAAVAETVAVALAAMSNGAVVDYTGLIAQKFSPQQFGTNAEYPNAEDKAVLTYICQDFTLIRLSIPAPILAIFLADGETVDPAGTLLGNLTTALLTNDAGGGGATNVHGSFVHSLVGGARSRKRFQRKTTIWTKDPTESIPEE